MDGTPPQPTVVVADDDLFFSARISAVLTSLGYVPVVVRTLDAFRRELAQAPAAGIVNLAAHRFDAAAAVRGAKDTAGTRSIPLLGFCGHRDVARQAAAREAGCDLVVTNGAVSAGLPGLLHSLLERPRHER
jgi:CheY-like chemotaxis protein